MLQVTKKQARQFILSYQGLMPPRQLAGKEGIMAFIRRVGCIQYDPLDVAGTNPNLVLQARVRDYKPGLLEELLYSVHKLIDAWDKQAAFYPVEDWPYFSFYRTRKITRHGRELTELYAVLPRVLEEVRVRGPLASTDFADEERVDWFWGPSKPSRAALETLCIWGDLVVCKRVGNKRFYDLACRHIPEHIVNAPNPFSTQEDYWQWHVKRRIASVGMMRNQASDAWLGIKGLKSPQRQAAFAALEEKGEIVPIKVEGLTPPLYMLREQLSALTENGPGSKPEAAFIAPLDNLLWDRKLLAALFDFEYTWEVYKPVSARQYGYYVLPVLYGDEFVARFEPRFNKKAGVLEILNWWWEPGVRGSQSMNTALAGAAKDFMDYLGAAEVKSRVVSPFSAI